MHRSGLLLLADSNKLLCNAIGLALFWSVRHLKIDPRPTTQCVTDPAPTCCKCDRLPYVVAKLETEEEESRRRRSKCVFLWDHQQIQITLPATKLTNAQPHADQVSIHSSGPYMPGDLPARCCLFLRPDLDVKFKILKLSHQIYVAHA